ncbi:hypothetical protein [Ralstonia pickettii]|uniref:hypothetical protein n=1 Tax=Ralstonia pickettii TaxID=329 RepID=UPI00046A9F71|nr:hypothetical protein [Ralstonia pickettii]
MENNERHAVPEDTATALMNTVVFNGAVYGPAKTRFGVKRHCFPQIPSNGPQTDQPNQED